MPDKDIRVHEVTFCSRVSKWADTLFASDTSLPFKRTEIEQSKGIKKKRPDLRVYDGSGKLILAGIANSAGVESTARSAYDLGYNVALVTTDLTSSAAQVIERYASRWSIEVAIEDAKQIVGVGQARNRLPSAVERTVPFTLAVNTLAVSGTPPPDTTMTTS